MRRERAIEVLKAWDLNWSDEFTANEFEQAFAMAISALSENKGEWRKRGRRMTREDIDNIISTICPNDEDSEKPCISPAFLKKELEALALEQEPCEDTISRQSAINGLIEHTSLEGCDFRDTENMLNSLPPVQPIRPKGKWIFDEVLDKHYYCSECKSMGVDYWDYCPNCGVKMESEEVAN